MLVAKDLAAGRLMFRHLCLLLQLLVIVMDKLPTVQPGDRKEERVLALWFGSYIVIINAYCVNKEGYQFLGMCLSGTYSL